eukprot:TRINITY_DN64258_c0_g1_i1.p1 TRINITY_DN64258_c0_g1~~TRINITY_DN64258_c0_g1_i1.p1  ORF type:complete len:621 (+),score=78.74 TRINITY_DN64258_c0_g1_i1:45-1907(+)
MALRGDSSNSSSRSAKLAALLADAGTSRVVASASVGRSLLEAASAEEQDSLCARWSSNCTACVLASMTPHQGRLVQVRCQFASAGRFASPACIALPPLATYGASDALTDWLATTPGSGGLRRASVAVPRCRALIRDAGRCPGGSTGGGDAAELACINSKPLCNACTATGNLCGFCGEADGASASAPSQIRCLAGSDSPSTSPCGVRCAGREYRFRVDDAPLRGEDSAPMPSQGVIKYPLWREHGLTYAPEQRCMWRLGVSTRSGTTVSGSMEHSLSSYDAVHVTHVGLARGKPPIVVGASSQRPFVLDSLLAPVTLQFFSDDAREGAGFTLRWTASSPSSSPAPAQNTADASQESSSGFLGNFGSDEIIVALVIAGAVTLALCCFLCACAACRWKSRAYSADAGPQSSRHAASFQARPPPTPPAPQRKQTEERPSNAAASGSAARSAQPSSRASNAQKAAPSSRSGTGPNKGSAPKAPSPASIFAEAPSRSAGAPSARSNETAAQQGLPKSQAARPPASPPRSRSSSSPPPPPPPPPQPARPSPEPLETALSGVIPDAHGHITAIHQEMMQHMNAPAAERKAILRELQRKWHPDKNNEDDKAVSTAVFQHLSANSEWFLA